MTETERKKESKKLRYLQIYSGFLWLCFLYGSYYAIRDKEYLPSLIGMCVNLLLQYGMVVAIRQQKARLAKIEG